MAKQKHSVMKAVALALLWASTAVALPDACSEEIKTGNCKASIRKYGYDRCTHRCIPYTYGGCGGSMNMFDTMKECQQKCGKPEDRCSKPLEKGICMASMKRYGFDSATKKCKAFIYGGCGGNDNNFETMAECRETCKDDSKEEESTPDFCSLEPDEGQCKAKEDRYAYDPKVGKCVQFVYSGCGGNDNNFMNEADCMKACSKAVTPRPDGNACSQPIEVGPCKGLLKRFAYDITKKKCVQFYYGGCQGNQNNFETLADCTSTCGQQKPDSNTSENICSQPITVGQCKASIPRFAYDSKQGKCVPFIFGGCGGNGNNFEDLDDCQEMCQPQTQNPNPGSGEEEDDDNICKLPIEVGPCTALKTRFAFDTEQQKCVPFIYGGCEGNKNNFLTEKECVTKCEQKEPSEPKPTTTTPEPGFDICLLPIKAGPCKSLIKRYAFDKPTKLCVPFFYGGCQGNENNFETKEECEKQCPAEKYETEPGDICEQPIERGPCKGAIPRYAYDSEKGECVDFRYGGCGGNENNFLTKEICESRCMKGTATSTPKPDEGTTTLIPQPEQDICSLPLDAGPCKGSFTRYGYDSKKGKCVKFTYGGCKGNENNFLKRKDCKEKCMQETTTPIPLPENEICSLPIDVGPCKGNITRFAYNAKKGKCVKFAYGGCLGNANNFLRRKDCKEACMQQTTIPEAENDRCSQPIESGPCRASIPRYAYDKSLKRCVPFTYGGCKGNDNNFESVDECQLACEEGVSIDGPASSPCTLPLDEGECNLNLIRYGFKNGKCVPFRYGGCRGNFNRFGTLEDCEEACQEFLTSSAVSPWILYYLSR